MHRIHGIQGVQTHARVVLLLKVRGSGGGGSVCNRLVTSIGELTPGPFPCQSSPGGDFFFSVRRILDGSG